MLTFTRKNASTGGGTGAPGVEREQWIELEWTPEFPSFVSAAGRAAVAGAYDVREVDLSHFLWAVEGFNPEVVIDWMDGSAPERFTLAPRGGDLIFGGSGVIRHRYADTGGESFRARIHGAFGFGGGDWDSQGFFGETSADGLSDAALAALAQWLPDVLQMWLHLVAVRMSEGEDILFDVSDEFEDEEGEGSTHVVRVHVREVGEYRLDVTPWVAVASAEDGIFIDWGDGWGKEHYGLEQVAQLGNVLRHSYAAAGVYEVRVDTVRITEEEPEVAGWPRNNGYALKGIDYAFYGCVQLRSVPGKLLYDSQRATRHFNGWMFKGCRSLHEIPAGFLDYCAQDNVVGAVFGYSGIRSVPVGLFDKLVNVTMVDSPFYECKYLSSVPSGLLAKMRKAEEMNGVFLRCSSLRSVPAALFYYNTRVRTFSGCFEGSGLESVPEDLFRYNTQVESFINTFKDCKNLRTVPEGLFRYNTRAKSFWSSFDGAGLEVVPQELFRYNVAAEDFSRCFAGTNAILFAVDFRYNTKATNFTETYKGCASLEYFNGFFPDGASEFVGCFSGDGVLRSLPELWKTHAGANGSRCFEGCEKAGNFNDAQQNGWA